MLKAYRFRLKPTKEQAEYFVRTFGCVRFVWNYMLCMRRQELKLEGVFLGRSECSRILTELKEDEGHQWLNDVDSIALQTTLEYQLESWQRFFGKQGGRPHFKSRKDHNDAYTTFQHTAGREGAASVDRLGRTSPFQKAGRKDTAGNGQQESGRKMVCFSAL